MIVAAGLVVVALVVVAIRNPLVRRIGLRNAVRRPREAALVMLGCILGTALIVGNASVGDSFTASIRHQALSDFGVLDATVSYDSRDSWAAGNARLAQVGSTNYAATSAVAVMNAPLTSEGRAAPRANLIEADYRRAGPLAAAPGVTPGTGPTGKDVWVSRGLAQRLALHVGSPLTIHAPTPVQMRVGRIESSALVSFLDADVKAGNALLVPPGTVLAQQAQNPTRVHPSWLTLVVGRGSHAAVAPDPKQVESLRRALTKTVTPFNGEVQMVRHQALVGAIEAGKANASFLTTIGAFGIIAGILLLVNVLLMLAEERQAEMGTMRAVGMSRRPLVGSFSLEGGIYAAVGSLIGGGCGVALGRGLIAIMEKQTSRPKIDWRGLPLHFEIQGATLWSGIAMGFLVSVIAVVGTSYRVSRMEVIRSLRGLPDPKHGHRRSAVPLATTGVIVGPLLAVLGYTAPKGALLLLGVVLTALSAGVLLARRVAWETAVIATCLPLLCVTVPFALIDPEVQRGPAMAVLAGVVSVTAAVFAVNALQTRLARFLSGLAGGRGTVPARLGFANPVAHRVRMLLTVGPLALVIFTLTYAEGLSHLVSTELNGTAPIVGGGFSLYADSNPVAPFDFTKYRNTKVTHVAPTGTVYGSFIFSPDKPAIGLPVTGFDHRLYDKVDPPPLVSRDPKFKTDRDAWAAVAKDPDLMIATDGFLFNGALGPSKDAPTGPASLGDTFTLRDPVTGQARDVTLVGLEFSDVLGNGPYLGSDGLKKLFGDRFVESNALMATTAPTVVIDQLQLQGVDNGVRVVDIAETARNDFSTISGLINLFRSDLGIGVIVGIAGIGVVLVRSVRDRRHQIGVLRAMGVDAGEIGTSFLIEGAYVSFQGLFVGVAVGIATVAALTNAPLLHQLLGFSPPLRPPPVTILILAVSLFVAGLLASALPARSASKIPPAIALRLVD
jgi:putative ABC transport system permease protein